MKKVFSILAIAVFTLTMMSGTVFAHNGHGNRHRAKSESAQTRHAVCTVESCTETGIHAHDGTWYCGQKRQTGGSAVCTVKGCTETGIHKHDGTWYCGQCRQTGDSAVCTVEGCTEIGIHKHDGTDYYCRNHSTGHGHGKSHSR